MTGLHLWQERELKFQLRKRPSTLKPESDSILAVPGTLSQRLEPALLTTVVYDDPLLHRRKNQVALLRAFTFAFRNWVTIEQKTHIFAGQAQCGAQDAFIGQYSPLTSAHMKTMCKSGQCRAKNEQPNQNKMARYCLSHDPSTV